MDDNPVDQLPLTQHLILEVLAARLRTGEDVWTFMRMRGMLSALSALSDAGYLTYQGDVTGNFRAALTHFGRRMVLDETYLPPGQRRTLQPALHPVHDHE